MIVYTLIDKETGSVVRDQNRNIIIFEVAPKPKSSRYNILAIPNDEINEIIYNENLNKDGIQD